MFNLITGNLESVSASKHATILYQFEYNHRQYIYYSNSGFGSDNQIYDYDNRITTCKILYFKNTDNLYINNNNKDKTIVYHIRENIATIYNIVNDENDEVNILFKKYNDYKNFNQIFNEYGFIVIYNILIKSMINKREQILYYVILNFLCFKEYATEVCINDIITLAHL